MGSRSAAPEIRTCAVCARTYTHPALPLVGGGSLLAFPGALAAGSARPKGAGHGVWLVGCPSGLIFTCTVVGFRVCVSRNRREHRQKTPRSQRSRREVDCALSSVLRTSCGGGVCLAHNGPQILRPSFHWVVSGKEKCKLLWVCFSPYFSLLVKAKSNLRIVVAYHAQGRRFYP